MSNTNTLALTETAYYILLSLLKPSHGYAIMQNVKRLTAGRINMGAGTLYGALSTMKEKGFIAECPCGDPSRREYIITPEGKLLLEKEISRLRELLANGEAILKGV